MSILVRLLPTNPEDVQPNWLYFVARRGGEAQRWAEEFLRPEHTKVVAGTLRALALLRTRRTEAGYRELEAAARAWYEVASASPDVYHVLGRWYFGASAYYHYCLEDFRGAEEALDLAQEEVRQSIERQRFLLPFAGQCHDFWLQRVRIARGQRLWTEMWRRVEITRQIATGGRPYCVLSDDTAIDLGAVQAFYSKCEPLTDLEREALRPIFDREIRDRCLRRSLSEIYTMTGFVIPYTPVPSSA